MFKPKATAVIKFVVALFFVQAAVVVFADDTNLEQEVQELRKENLELKTQLGHQTDVLNSLSQRVNQLEMANTSPAAATENSADDAAVPTKGGFNFGKINLSGEGDVAFFNTGQEGFAPNSEFRVDEARLFAEAPIWDEVYFYSEVDLATREDTGLGVNLNELYLDWQDISRWWGKDGQLNFRAGRLDIPFGEEYLTRYAIDDPLISHSLSDVWGVNPGLEFYGSLQKFNYAVAVQNGGNDGEQDFDGDKSVAGRIGYDPNTHLHFSLSGMRTGNISTTGDEVAALWLGNGLLRSLGSPATTRFHANLVEADMTARWNGGHVSAFGGYARYGDNDPMANNARNVYYYSIEGVQNISQKIYVAARFSQMLGDGGGFPMVGYGNYGDYYLGTLTTELWRLSLGLGYRFNERLVIKAEYSFEQGKSANGATRNNENFVGVAAAFGF